MTRTVSLFVSCFNDAIYPRTARAAQGVLERLGVKVDFPAEQTCCGQIHINTGYGSMAVPLIRHFVDVFSNSDELVSISGSCTATIREHYQELAQRTQDPVLIRRTDELVPKVHEFSQYLTDVLGVVDVGAAYPHKVCYHPTCHSLRSLHVYDSAVALLRAVRGLELVELPHAEQCCGFGGTFAVKNAPMSTAILVDKVANIFASGAETVVALDNSCLTHINGFLKRNKTGISTMHLAELLDHGVNESEV